LAVLPVDGGLFPALSVVTIDDRPGDQYDPHVSGDLVSYTDSNEIRLYDFSTGSNILLPAVGPDLLGYQLSDVSGQLVVFTNWTWVEETDTHEELQIAMYDVATASTTLLDPVFGAGRSLPAIGGSTIAFTENFLSGGQGEIFAARLPSAPVRITNDTRYDLSDVEVSPSGDLIVWASCDTVQVHGHCGVRQASWTGSAWVVTSLTENGDFHATPDTDGTVIAYSDTRDGETDIYWQPVGGGPEERLELPGVQVGASIRSGVIAFNSAAPGGINDVYLYQIATNRLFQLTSTPWREDLADIDALPSGQLRVVWNTDAGVDNRDIYGATLELPPVGPTYQFGGFASPVDAMPTLNQLKAGAAVPVKFSLSGDEGLAIFAAGYPRSQTIACDATAPVDGVEETVSAGGSSLTYDPMTGLYAYVWKTDRTWAGTCRQLVLVFADGSSARASFKFK
jgi:hypothetical protein